MCLSLKIKGVEKENKQVLAQDYTQRIEGGKYL